MQYHYAVPLPFMQYIIHKTDHPSNLRGCVLMHYHYNGPFQHP